MLLRNFDNLVNGYIVGVYSATVSENNWLKGFPHIIKAYNGTCYRVTNCNLANYGLFGSNADSATNLSSISDPKLLLGSSDADESYEDYTLELITTLKVPSARGVTYSTQNGVHKCVLTKTFVNNTNEDVTVKEMGVYANAQGTTSSSSTSFIFLVAREKLAEPVTIPANGGIATFTMTITIPVVDNSAT